VKEVVEHRPQRKKEDGRESEKHKTEFGEGCLGSGRAPEVDPGVGENDVGRLLAEHYGNEGVESGVIHEPSSGHDVGGLNRQRWQASKHSIGEGGDAETQMLPPNDGDQYSELPPS